MPSITVKNIPQELYENLKQSADEHHRSLNREMIACLERAIGNRKIDPEDILARARQLHKKWRGRPITDAQLTRAKTLGRP